MQFDVIVIGGGASGLLAAGQAAKAGAKTLLLERNQRVGRKLLITGKGRCNVTNNCDRDKLMGAVMRNPRFLYGAFSVFPPQEVMAFFEELGVKLKTERGTRVFPQSDKAMEVVDALASFVKSNGVVIKQHRVGELILKNGVIAGVKTVDSKEFTAPCVVVATGGLSYPLTGSTGDGYLLGKQAGHTILPTAPSLVPIALKEKWCADLMGLSLKNVVLSVRRGEKLLFNEIGELMFTHFGISGPLVLSASAQLDGDVKNYSLLVDLKPGLTLEQLSNRLLRDFDDSKNRAFKNCLDRLMPKSLVPIIVSLSAIPPDTQVNSVTKEQRQALAELLKAVPLTPVSLRNIDEAVVTRGGIAVNEVSPKTLQSKLVKGLFFCGEVLDLDAVTGGFNLQIAFSTGYVAGLAAADYASEVKEDE